MALRQSAWRAGYRLFRLIAFETAGEGANLPAFAVTVLLMNDKFGSIFAKLNCRGLGPALSTDWLRFLRLYLGNIWLMLAALLSMEAVVAVVGVAVVGVLAAPPVNEDNENCAGAGMTNAAANARTAAIGKILRTLCLP